MKAKYKLEGLTCSHCAGKIECELSNNKDVKDVNLNFSLGTVTLDSKMGESDIQRIVDSIEEGITVKKVKDRSDSKRENTDIKKEIVRLVIAVAFLIAGLFFRGSAIGLILFLTAYIISGKNVLQKAFKNILKGNMFDENFLMGIATIGAFIIGEYVEGVAVMIFYEIGEIVQGIAVNKSSNMIIDLMDLDIDSADLLVDGSIKRVHPSEVKVGDIIVIKASNKVPLDGYIVEGESSIDTKALTGESLPVEVGLDDKVYSGSINLTGTISIKVTSKYEDSTASKIMELVEEASAKKAKTEKFITKFSKYYTPLVVLAASIIAFLPPILGMGSFTDWIRKGLVFLVISCPCALVISVPLAYFGGIGGASRKGILVKGGNYLEALTNVGTVVFDKTGTLTKGKFTISRVESYQEDKDIFLEKIATIESHSEHPISKCIAGGRHADMDRVKDYKELAGFGVKGTVDGDEYLVGSSKLMKDMGVNFEMVRDHGTIVYVAKNKKYVGYILLEDEIKSDSKQGVAALTSQGIDTVMLTGDNEVTADYVADKIGISKVHAKLLPSDKVNILSKYLNKEKSTIFVGDGINDAPVLAKSDIGIAMGAVGSDAAIEAADVVILNDEISKIGDSIAIAHKTKNIVIQNIVIALLVKALVMVFGVAGFASLWAAVFADVGVALIAILNAGRIIKNPM